VALAVSPARAVLRAPASRTLELSNFGMSPVSVAVGWRSLGQRNGPSRWFTIAPRRLVLRSGAHTVLTVRAGPGASPGDHRVLVFVTGRPVNRKNLAVRLRVGVRLHIRAPGKLVHQIALNGIRALRFRLHRALRVSVANRGNVTEQLRGRLTVTLVARNRVLSRLRFGRFRELYPGTRALIELRYAGRARGVVTAIVTVRLGAHVRPLERRYRLLL
jgi:hypothetical protein